MEFVEALCKVDRRIGIAEHKCAKLTEEVALQVAQEVSASEAKMEQRFLKLRRDVCGVADTQVSAEVGLVAQYAATAEVNKRLEQSDEGVITAVGEVSAGSQQWLP